MQIARLRVTQDQKVWAEKKTQVELRFRRRGRFRAGGCCGGRLRLLLVPFVKEGAPGVRDVNKHAPDEGCR